MRLNRCICVSYDIAHVMRHVVAAVLHNLQAFYLPSSPQMLGALLIRSQSL